MPVIQITIVKGREDEKIQQCMREVARVVSTTLECPVETVRVMVNEVPPSRFAVGDRLKSDG
jgi:4-oxalocrotonate tautomerase